MSDLFVNISKSDSKKVTIDELIEYINLNYTKMGEQKNHIKNNYNKYIFKNNLQTNKSYSNNSDQIKKSNSNLLSKSLTQTNILFISSQDNYEPLPKLSGQLSDIFEKFTDKITKFNITKFFTNDHGHNNISLFSSVLACIKEDYLSISKEQQYKYIDCLITNILNNLSTIEIFKELEYDLLGWNSVDIIKNLKTYTPSNQIIRILADYFHINILIIDIINDQVYSTSIINRFKKTILLINVDKNFYEPCFYKTINNKITKIYDNNDILIKYLFDIENSVEICDIKYLDKNSKTIKINEDYEGDDIDKYITKINKLKKKRNSQLSKIKYSLAEKRLLNLMNRDKYKNRCKEESTSSTTEVIESVLIDSEQKVSDNTNQSDSITETDTSNNNNETNNNETDNNINIEDNNNRDFLNVVNILKEKKYCERKMKLDEIHADAKKLNISLTVLGSKNNMKNKTKKELINDIKHFLSGYPN